MTVKELIENRNTELYVLTWKNVLPCWIERYSLCSGTCFGDGPSIDGTIEVVHAHYPHERFHTDLKDLFTDKNEAEAALEELLKYPSRETCVKAEIEIATARCCLSGYKDEKSKDIVRRLKEIEKEISKLYRYDKEQ